VQPERGRCTIPVARIDATSPVRSERRMRLFITGATGTIGRRLVLDRIERGERVVLLARDPARASKLFAADSNSNITIVEGDCAIPGRWQRAVNGVDAVIHLAGVGIAARRWTTTHKEAIRRSRVDGTHQIVNAIEDAARRPPTFISASATGYYGDAGDRELDEKAPPGDDFLASVCVDWEAQAQCAADAGVRTAILRLGVVLDPRGGAIKEMLPIFRRGLGGPIGSGRQYVPWVHWRDVLGTIALVLENPSASGAINVVAPNPATSREFAQALGDAVGRPSLVRAPRWAVRMLKGELADFLVSSQRAIPARLLELGLRFVQPEIVRAMQALLTPSDATNRAVRRLETSLAVVGGVAGGGVVGGVGAPGSAALRRREARPAPERVRLLAIDVDGTLLRTDGRLPNRVTEAVQRAELGGCSVVLATARSPRLMRELTTTLRLQSPTINSNGAIIWNHLEERAQYHEAIPVELSWAVVNTARQVDPEVVVELERHGRCHTDRIDPVLQRQINRIVRPDTCGTLDEFLSEPLSRICFVASPERLEVVAEALRKGFWRHRTIAMFRPHPALLQVTHPMADKGIALQRIANRLQCAKREVMAIGDAVNDMGMLDWAGFSVAMGNAPASVKALADVEAPSCDDAGVAWAIERFVLRTARRSERPIRPTVDGTT